jgi:DNA-binding FrmR family transcriptional regulator
MSRARNTDDRERSKLLNRARRIRGQAEAIERMLADENEDCADVLQLLASCRGAINSLMAEVLEDHIRDHVATGKPSPEIADDLIDIVRAYLK